MPSTPQLRRFCYAFITTRGGRTNTFQVDVYSIAKTVCSHYICHSVGGDWVLPYTYLLASGGTDNLWQALFFGTLVIVAGYSNSVVTQAKKADKNQILIA